MHSFNTLTPLRQELANLPVALFFFLIFSRFLKIEEKNDFSSLSLAVKCGKRLNTNNFQLFFTFTFKRKANFLPNEAYLNSRPQNSLYSVGI